MYLNLDIIINYCDHHIHNHNDNDIYIYIYIYTITIKSYNKKVCSVYFAVFNSLNINI